MKKLLFGILIVVITLFFWTGNIIAKDVNPNGFPSGMHYNLNIIGKKTGFTCPLQEYDPDTGDPIYGNVVFVPEKGKNIEIFMQSGKGKKAEEISELRVIDPCAVFDGDGAIIQLPKNEAGYRVYARALAKPTDETIVTTPELSIVLDEQGNDLVYLGFVTDNGFQKPFETFMRKKGKSTAIDITGLFLWSGIVCYLSPPDSYQDKRESCCIDTDGDGIFNECIDPVLVDGSTSCPENHIQITLYCSDYTEEWVFNIGDFVEYLWNTDNNGVKLLQVRFYPN